MQYPTAGVGILKKKRPASQLIPHYFRAISTDSHHFVQGLAEQHNLEIVQPPKDIRREDWVEPFYQNLRGQNGKVVEHRPKRRQTMTASNDRYLEVQQDVLKTFVDRGQSERLRQATVSPTGRRTPGLKLDDPRLLAVLQTLICFAFLAGRGRFWTTTDLQEAAAEALGKMPETSTLGQLCYDLAKLRGKGLVERIARTQAYRLPPKGYRIAVPYLKLFHRIYAPLTAGTLEPGPGDDRLPPERPASLDRLYAAVDHALKQLFESVG